MVGNGNQLRIANVGHITVASHTLLVKTLHLKNVLHVPNIAKNLLNISPFNRDNSSLAEFCGDYYLIKDKTSKRILLKGLLKDCLYKLQLQFGYVQFVGSPRDAIVYVSEFSIPVCNKKHAVDKISVCVKPLLVLVIV